MPTNWISALIKLALMEKVIYMHSEKLMKELSFMYMNYSDEIFNELLESVKQAGDIRKGKRKPSAQTDEILFQNFGQLVVSPHN